MDAVWQAAAQRAPALAPHLDQITRDLAAARAKFPEASVGDAAFAGALAERLLLQRDQAAALTRLRAEDLLLAQWCATGDPRAIAAFERTYRSDLDAVLARFRRLQVPPDELRQSLRIKLFVGAGTRPPRIADYSGFGFLQNWLRVTALRALVDISRSERARQLEELLDEEVLLGVATPQSDLSGRYSRAELGHAIKQAFARAVANLAPRGRNFLRHAHVDQLTLDQIAGLYGIHRATVARTLAAAREELVQTTRRELAQILGLADAELDSMVRSADSRIELSLSRVLAAPEPETIE
ncbi:MAG: sigma-70 family RNA polymerase sigma factor [Acidobacteriota bacterium]